MRKRMLAIVLGVLVFSLVAASAASLGTLNVADVGAASEIVASCDEDGMDVDFTTSHNGIDHTVASVVLVGVDPACDGQEITVTVSDGSLVLGSGTVTAGTSGTETVAISGAPLAQDVTYVSVLIAG